jgi:mono/diheme cytochrome c family protein
MPTVQADLGLNWKTTRASPLDLEISGELLGLPTGDVRYLTRKDLLALPQVSYTVTDDSNFTAEARVRGVELEVLARKYVVDADSAMVVAVCSDFYRAHYSQDYLHAHRPLLVLEINGEAPEGWPKSREGAAMGPYLISHARFTPAFKILAHEDEAQIPWGVVRLEFRNEKVVLETIAPRGARAGDPAVQAGYGIAQQNCFRCHAPDNEKHQKGKLTWSGIALFASQAPKNFAAYVRNPRAIAEYAEMPGNPAYDEATIQALISYFQTFSPVDKR